VYSNASKNSIAIKHHAGETNQGSTLEDVGYGLLCYLIFLYLTGLIRYRMFDWHQMLAINSAKQIVPLKVACHGAAMFCGQDWQFGIK